MEITINIPDILPKERLQKLIKEIESRLKLEARLFEKMKSSDIKASENDDPWSNPDLELPSIDTGIEDFSKASQKNLANAFKRIEKHRNDFLNRRNNIAPDIDIVSIVNAMREEQDAGVIKNFE